MSNDSLSFAEYYVNEYLRTGRFKKALENGEARLARIQADAGSADRAERSDRTNELAPDSGRTGTTQTYVDWVSYSDGGISTRLRSTTTEFPKGVFTAYFDVPQRDRHTLLRHIQAAASGDLGGAPADGAAQTPEVEPQRGTTTRRDGIEPPDWGNGGCLAPDDDGGAD